MKKRIVLTEKASVHTLCILNRIALPFLFIALVACGEPPPGYYDSAFGKAGAALKNALHEIINDHTVLPYSGGTNNTAEALKTLDEDPTNTNNVVLLYAERSEPKSTFGQTTGWNREHLWPNSYGLDDDPPAYTDLFNLRAEDTTVNSARGNKLFDESSASDRNFRVPGHAEAPGTSTDSDSWEPPNSVKGDIARVLFYMDARYEGDRVNEPDLRLTEQIAEISSATNLMGRLSTMLLWHELDPVDEQERARNDLINERYQHNRNPFVDCPEWVDAIFKPQIKIAMTNQIIRISWPSEFSNAVLTASEDLQGTWTPAAGGKTISSSEVIQSEAPTDVRRFFRLKIQ